MDARWQEALNATRGLAATPKNIERIATELGAEFGRWAFQQWTLRERARVKFAKADEMLFDRPGLEMASHERLAAYHASRFPQGQTVADLTTGIGADLISLASRGMIVPVMGIRHRPGGDASAIGFELDPRRADYADHNLKVHGLKADLRLEDCLAADWDFDYAFADPARRNESARTWNPQEFSPHPVQLWERMSKLKLGGMKLSPMIRDDFFRHLPGRLEFVSFDGECREALLWTGSEAESGRWAVKVTGNKTGTGPGTADIPVGQTSESPLVSIDVIQASEETGPFANKAEDFLFEADPAVVRAHALPTLAERHQIELLGDSNAYLTGCDPVESPWLTPFQVFADHPADLRKTATILKNLGAGTPVVKSRVPRLEVDQLRKQLRGDGRELIVAVYPVGKQLRHAIIERL